MTDRGTQMLPLVAFPASAGYCCVSERGVVVSNLSMFEALGRSGLGAKPVKRRVFISFFKEDREEVDNFVDEFSDVFTPRALGVAFNDDIINSTNPTYVMQQIKEKYLGDSTVTIVMLGTCTHSRRYVDWEIKASLQQGSTDPNGLIGILIPRVVRAHLPPRFKLNWNSENKDSYARYHAYPSSDAVLRSWIEDAFSARSSRAKHIVNPNDMMKYNSKCLVCRVTHQ